MFDALMLAVKGLCATRPGSVLVLLAACVMISSCASGQIDPPAFRAGDSRSVRSYAFELLEKRMQENKVVGLSVALVDEGGVVWAGGIGQADAARNIEADDATRYRIGSVTKPLTAMVVARLVDRGVLSFDDHLEEKLPEFHVQNRFADQQSVTLRHLLSHHSGLPSDRMNGMWGGEPVGLARLEEQLEGTRLTSPAGAQFRYSNVGYSLLGRVIERATGEGFPTAMKHEVFEPLGMEDSVVTAKTEGLADLAPGYMGGEPYPPLALRDTPAGGVTSTVTDMAKVVVMLMRGGDGYLHGDTADELLRWQGSGETIDFGHHVGFDWVLTGLPLQNGSDMIWHAGSAYPHYAFVGFTREGGLGIVILSNSMEASRFAADAARDILNAEANARGLGRSAAQPAERVFIDARIGYPVTDAERIVGHYTIQGQAIEIERNGSGLATRLWGHRIRLGPQPDGHFSLSASALGLFRIPLDQFDLRFDDVDGQVLGIVRGAPGPIILSRIPQRDISRVWSNRAGCYQTTNSTGLPSISNATLAVADGFLVLEADIGDPSRGAALARVRLPFVPIDDHEAVHWGFGDGEGGNLVAVEGDILEYSGYRLEHCRTGQVQRQAEG